MITIIHGDDIVSSRRFFQEKKQEQKDSITFDASKMTITDLAQAIFGSGLFSDTKSIFIEDFLTKTKKANSETKEIINFITKNHGSSNIILWEGKEIQKRDVFVFKEAILKKFKLPQSIFMFLDSIRPNNFKNLIILFHKTLDAGINQELIFFMIQRQIRLLLALSDNSTKKTIDELMRLFPWQKEKLVRQARLFSVDQLRRIYNFLYKIELGFKTGKLNLTLPQAIDFLLFEI
ncbi:MAG: hypothetical protein HYT07_03200 [Candidatus Levybacteria bacterium]|nr:hypothetical protein [Candidatus Levybacteria bacterium]